MTTDWQLPTWQEVSEIQENQGTSALTPLEYYIWENTPAGVDAPEFRRQLYAAILDAHEKIMAAVR